MTAAKRILPLLTAVRAFRNDFWTFRCPVHNDKPHSAEMVGWGDRVLILCHAGCKPTEILEALGLRYLDLFDYTDLYRPDPGASHRYQENVGLQLWQESELARIRKELRERDDLLRSVDTDLREGLITQNMALEMRRALHQDYGKLEFLIELLEDGTSAEVAEFWRQSRGDSRAS